MREGRFREDLYYRLCSDVIVAPSLHERIADSPEELSTLALFLAQRLVGDDEAPALAREVEAWVERELGRDYPWPGNVRELAQCVSNVLIRREYRPAAAAVAPRKRHPHPRLRNPVRGSDSAARLTSGDEASLERAV